MADTERSAIEMETYNTMRYNTTSVKQDSLKGVRRSATGRPFQALGSDTRKVTGE